MAGAAALLDISPMAITAASATTEQTTIATIPPADNDFFVFWWKWLYFDKSSLLVLLLSLDKIFLLLSVSVITVELGISSLALNKVEALNE